MDNKLAALAADRVTAHVQLQHARAVDRLAALRLKDQQTVVTAFNVSRRMQNGRDVRFAEAMERAWRVLLDTAYGVADDGIVIDDGGE